MRVYMLCMRMGTCGCQGVRRNFISVKRYLALIIPKSDSSNREKNKKIRKKEKDLRNFDADS